MKKILNVIILLLVIVSCVNHDNVKKKQKENAKQDSIKVESQKQFLINQLKKDSLQKAEHARIDSIQHLEELKVVGEIRFGMTKSEFKKSEKNFNNKCKSRISEYGTTRIIYKIGNYEYSWMYDGYYNDRLYSLTIIGEYIKTDYYDTKMREQVESLYSVLESKYGEPREDFGFPKWHNIEENETVSLAYWVIGDKIIQVEITSGGSLYSLDLRIFLMSINRKLKSEYKQRKIEEAKKGADLL